MSNKQHPTSDDHNVVYTHSGDPRSAGIPTTGRPVSPTSKDADTLRHPNTGHFKSKGK